jgi:hypothetical protein
MESKHFTYDTKIQQSEICKGGAFVIFPFNIKAMFDKGRVKVNAKFDGVSYSGSVVNMGLKDNDGNVCYILGITKAIRKEIGDNVNVEVDVIP